MGRYHLNFPKSLLHGATVDGRNPAPVGMANIPLFTGFHTCWVLSRISSINSMVILVLAWMSIWDLNPQAILESQSVKNGIPNSPCGGWNQYIFFNNISIISLILIIKIFINIRILRRGPNSHSKI